VLQKRFKRLRRIQDEESEEEQEKEADEERDAIANELFEGSGDVSSINISNSTQSVNSGKVFRNLYNILIAICNLHFIAFRRFFILYK